MLRTSTYLIIQLLSCAITMIPTFMAHHGPEMIVVVIKHNSKVFWALYMDSIIQLPAHIFNFQVKFLQNFWSNVLCSDDPWDAYIKFCREGMPYRAAIRHERRDVLNSFIWEQFPGIFKVMWLVGVTEEFMRMSVIMLTNLILYPKLTLTLAQICGAIYVVCIPFIFLRYVISAWLKLLKKVTELVTELVAHIHDKLRRSVAQDSDSIPEVIICIENSISVLPIFLSVIKDEISLLLTFTIILWIVGQLLIKSANAKSEADNMHTSYSYLSLIFPSSIIKFLDIMLIKRYLRLFINIATFKGFISSILNLT